MPEKRVLQKRDIKVVAAMLCQPADVTEEPVDGRIEIEQEMAAGGVGHMSENNFGRRGTDGWGIVRGCG